MASGEDSVIRMRGDIGLEVEAAVRAEVGTVLEAADGVLTVDLAEVTFMDARGLALMVWIKVAGAERGTTVRFREAPPLVTRLLKLTGLAGFLLGPTATS